MQYFKFLNLKNIENHVECSKCFVQKTDIRWIFLKVIDQSLENK